MNARRSRPGDAGATAWRIRQIAGPELALRYLHAQAPASAAGADAKGGVPPLAPPSSPPAVPGATAPQAPGPALPDDPIGALASLLREQVAQALPALPAHERRPVADLASRIDAMVAGRQPGSGLAAAWQALVPQAEHQVRHAGAATPGAAATRGERVLDALQALKLAVGRQGLMPGTPALFDAATDVFVRLGRATQHGRASLADRTALALWERDEARPLAAQALALLRAGHATTLQPAWPGTAPSPDPLALFFSGCGGMVARAVQAAAAQVGLRMEPGAPAGAEAAAARWRSLLRSNLAVFDLGDRAPHVYHELGLALVAGPQLVLLAPQGLELPFDVAQNVTRYADAADLAARLPAALDAAAYGVQVLGPRMAAPAAPAAVLPGGVTVCPRWRPVPASATPRWFAVMPFQPTAFARWRTLRRCLAGPFPSVQAVRGDIAEGQHIVASIWTELCQATHVTVDLSGLNLNVCLEAGIAQALGRRTLFIGQAGTAQRLAMALPALSKWRCHEYGTGAPRGFAARVQAFFADPAGTEAP